MEGKIILLILKIFTKIVSIIEISKNIYKNSFYNRDNYKKTTSENKL